MGHLASDSQVPERAMTVAEVGEKFVDSETAFEEMARVAFEHQRSVSPIYGRFAEGHDWSDWMHAPFLPVEAFKWDGIAVREDDAPGLTFWSSGTGGSRSRHPVLNVAVYERSVTAHFERVFGTGPFDIVAHLPTYRASDKPSSLLYMVDILIARFGTERSLFVDDSAGFVRALSGRDSEAPLLVFGTAFGLLDIVERQPSRLSPTAKVVETGGMKTYRREITRQELHERLAVGFNVDRSAIFSEYGMCELLSQCYTRGGEIFFPPPWVRFKVVDVENPEHLAENGYPGLLALFDLANMHSVSAVLTSDLAIERSGGFELLGRADDAEIRGCNFLIGSDP